MRNNTFSGHVNGFLKQIEEFSPKIFGYMPDNYFGYSQSPLIYISYTSNLKKEDVVRETTEIDSNTFRKNQHMQVEHLDFTFKASLIQFKSSINAKLEIRGNLIEQNSFIGSQSALVSIEGGVMTIEDNVLRNNGYISDEDETNHPDSVDLAEFASFPYT